MLLVKVLRSDHQSLTVPRNAILPFATALAKVPPVGVPVGRHAIGDGCANLASGCSVGTRACGAGTERESDEARQLMVPVLVPAKAIEIDGDVARIGSACSCSQWLAQRC